MGGQFFSLDVELLLQRNLKKIMKAFVKITNEQEFLQDSSGNLVFWKADEYVLI